LSLVTGKDSSTHIVREAFRSLPSIDSLVVFASSTSSVSTSVRTESSVSRVVSVSGEPFTVTTISVGAMVGDGDNAESPFRTLDIPGGIEGVCPRVGV
jgi:hypothetical protein